VKIAIFGRTFSPDFQRYIVELFQNLYTNNIKYYIYQPFYNYLTDSAKCDLIDHGTFENINDLPDDVDFMVSIGGDGTFLESIKYLKNFDIPVIGLNSGRLGFLANISKEEITEAFNAIINGKYELENRSLLTLECESIKLFEGKSFALNDASIQKKDSSMITIDAYLDGEFLNTYWTDGLIISTPTGSTAYSLSAGGPIVLPGSKSFVIAPIASHNLTVRPLIIPDSTEIRLKVKTRSGNFQVTIDNRTCVMDEKNNSFLIRRAGFNLKMVKLPFNNYYTTIRNKLMWGADIRN
jgi:NAD+ kinase